ncbi:MAG: Gfo/Idh/MocA family oxidoreductase [Candidatus Poribacteria bacterium]|nr:Gfo/Idh/MocA family oxidoreductase [Candidatus Poribacteria bacterium]
MSNEKTYRAALIGCGGRGMHLRGVANQADRIEVVAAADAFRINFEKLEPEGVAVYQHFEDMLDKESVDLVIVATPIATHYEVARRVLDFPIAGLYLEKSMAIRLWEADELVQRAEAQNVYFVVGHQLRYTQGWAGVRNLLDEGAIGQLHYIRAHRGSPLLTHHTHQTDLMRYYLDDSPVSWVLGQIHRAGSSLSEGMESEMQALGFVQFENGVSGIIESGQYKPSAGNHLMLIGEKGEIRAGSDARFRSEDTGGKWEPLPQYEQPHIFEDMLRWMEGGPEHRSAGRKGRDTLELLLAIYESSRSRGRVQLPLERRGNALEEMIADETLS